jgi:predicted P-loop ATPase
VGREVNDDFVRIVRLYLSKQFQRDFSKENVFEACMTLAAMSPFNPVNEYLDELKWDGTKRLDTWLTDYLGADDVPLNREIGRLVMIAAVRRARKPGTKFDQVLILEGKQGTGKSSALQILGGDWHSDTDLGRVETKEAAIALQGCWIFELGEMTAMGRSEIEALKAFLSRNADRYRAPYERALKSVFRRCVFIGTTNADGYLRDTTGNRRFWPVRTGEIDRERLKADRDQLWAEAAAAEASGESLELQPALREVASDAQQNRLINDPWADTLADCLQRLGETRVHTAALLYELGIPPGQQTQYQAKRLREVMVSLGWKYKKGIRVGGKILAGYEAPDGWTSTVPDVGDQSS